MKVVNLNIITGCPFMPQRNTFILDKQHFSREKIILLLNSSRL